MKYILTLSLFLMAFVSAQAQSSFYPEQETNLIFVRHAEKADDGTNDPSLNTKGVERSHKFAKLVDEEFEIAAIFSTPYKRTMETAQPLAGKLDQIINIYHPKDPAGLIELLKDSYNGGTVVVFGHSNTTPALTNMLLGIKKYDQLPEDEYGTYFIAKIHPDGAITDQVQYY